MESSVEQIPACASIATAARQLNHHDPTPEHHQQHRLSESHAALKSHHFAGLSHRAYTVARANYAPDKDKGAGGGGGNEKGYGHHDAAPAFAGTSSYPRPGYHLKPRRSWGAPAVSFPRTATTPQNTPSSSRATAASLLLVPGPPLPLPSNSFIPRRSSNRFGRLQEALKFNPYPYFFVTPPALPIATPNYFYGFTPINNSNSTSNQFYHLVSTTATTMSSSPATPSSPTQSNAGCWQEKLKLLCQSLCLPPPTYSMMSDRRGGRTAWSCVVTVGGLPLASARYWYNGHYNAYEDAAEVMHNKLDYKNVDWRQHHQTIVSPASPATSPTRAFGADSFSNYTTSSSPTQGGNSSGDGSSSIAGILDHRHHHSLSANARGESFVSNYSG